MEPSIIKNLYFWEWRSIHNPVPQHNRHWGIGWLYKSIQIDCNIKYLKYLYKQAITIETTTQMQNAPIWEHVGFRGSQPNTMHTCLQAYIYRWGGWSRDSPWVNIYVPFKTTHGSDARDGWALTKLPSVLVGVSGAVFWEVLISLCLCLNHSPSNHFSATAETSVS